MCECVGVYVWVRMDSRMGGKGRGGSTVWPFASHSVMADGYLSFTGWWWWQTIKCHSLQYQVLGVINKGCLITLKQQTKGSEGLCTKVLLGGYLWTLYWTGSTCSHSLTGGGCSHLQPTTGDSLHRKDVGSARNKATLAAKLVWLLMKRNSCFSYQILY